MQILPPESKITVRAPREPASESGLVRADAAAFVVAEQDRAAVVEALPHADLWKALLARAERHGKSPLLVSRLPNPRHTLATVGFLRRGASAYERLDLAGRMMRELVRPGVASLQCHAAGFDAAEAPSVLEAVASAALAAAAPMPQRKSKPALPPELRTIAVHGGRRADLDLAVALSRGNHLARWLTALPPNDLDCIAYRGALQRLARSEGWSFRFYGERALARLGAGAFLAVTRANPHRGAGIVRLTYRPPGARRVRRIGLVGKGVCFDTGGINLKSHKGMYLMHGDMQGSAVAVGTLLALARGGTPLEIDCWLALTENQIGPRAYRPQEVVQAMNGVTIQVVHSDAEGRMLLADTLALAARARPALLLDFATLTGACVNAITDRYSGAFTNRPELEGVLQEAGRASGERVWCFPMDEDFDTELDSSIADVLQCAVESKGDHILAARFLARFVPGDLPWAHIDLAASERKGGLAHVPTEFTGFGVRFAAQLLRGGALFDRLKSASEPRQ
jgi:leucyl aminopeptidase